MTHLTDSVKQVEEGLHLHGDALKQTTMLVQDHTGQLEQLSASFHSLAAASNETNNKVTMMQLALARMEKHMKGKDIVQESDKEVPPRRENRAFQENEGADVNKSMDEYYEERRRQVWQNEEHQYWSDQQNHQERRRYCREFEEDRWERNQHPRPAKLDFPKFDGDNPTGWLYKAE